MPVTTIYVRAGSTQVKEVIRNFVLACAGRAADTEGLVEDINTRIGLTALGLIVDAFVKKAHGGVDDAGMEWDQLSESRKRQRRKKDPADKMEILRDTGILLNSLTPGSESEEQIFEVKPGEVLVGTNVPYARAHQEGNPVRNLPQRRLWPEPDNWPGYWREDILDAAKTGVMDALMILLEGLV